jgi:hypothetical protein
MKTQIVTAVVDIQLAGEYKHFEVRIPDNVKTIDGVETSIRYLSDDINELNESNTTNDNLSMVIGDLRLSGGKSTNWFYAETISDYVALMPKDIYQHQQQNCSLPFMYHKRRDGNLCSVQPIGTRIKGYFKDAIGTTLQKNIHYSLTICIHLSTQ